jgi:hypothetical protein
MHNMWWSSVRDAIIGPQGDDGALHWSGLDVNEERERIVPAYFKCSHELWLINNDEYFRGELESLTFPGNGTKCKKGLEHFFRTKANADPEFKVPKITILKFEDCSESEGSDGGTNNRSNEEEDKEGNEEHDEDGDEGDDEEQDERSDRLSESDASNRVNISDE